MMFCVCVAVGRALYPSLPSRGSGSGDVPAGGAKEKEKTQGGGIEGEGVEVVVLGKVGEGGREARASTSGQQCSKLPGSSECILVLVQRSD
jgi:hypothetical protein